MNATDYKELNADFETVYNTEMKKLYLKYVSRINNNQIREMFCFYVISHCHKKNMDLLNRRNKRQLQFKKLKNQVEMLQAEKSIKSFEEGL